ncbi:hypothetical protein FXF50_04890 [Micromonospora sp. AP08]|uniref:hypothetical protein n=1 Tax=Micromonospora sp. AP08 TaxID=2604467 RepID=UPI0011D98514|nr:hypothetical protein [Micromonospora sp. AP08]TYB39717.1 hypothetical protein FXF50_04890 [Micromonospora sp. AP08]
MASVDVRELPVYTLSELSRWVRSTRHTVLTPAARWRVVVEQLTPISSDILLETVLQLRMAGETSSERISDLLQIPVDLVQNLQARIVTDKLKYSPGGQIRTGKSSVTWIYRDLATGELWPEPATDAPQKNMRYERKFVGTHEAGTAGRPVLIHCLLLDNEAPEPRVPTSIELARFSSASKDPNRRTVLVSDAERCLVMSPLMQTSSGPAVMTSLGTPHVALTQALSRFSAQNQQARRWLQNVPATKRPDRQQRTPLAAAIDELHEALAEWRASRSDRDHLISRAELALRRACDQRWYTARRDSFETSADEASRDQLIEKLGLSRERANTLMRAGLGSVEEAVLKLASDPAFLEIDAEWLRELADVTARWVDVVRHGLQASLEELAESVIDLCAQLQNSQEVVAGGQTE